MLEAAGVRVETRCQAEPPVALASATELESLFTSVAETELESLRGVPAPLLTAEIRKTEDRVVFTLRSNAPPFSREVLGRLFDPLFLRKPDGLGDGIGFSVCRKIADAHGGSFAVSRTMNGREYRLDLPAAQPAGRPDGASPAAAIPCLVVDDEARVRESWALMLRHLGYTIVMAASGTEALERLRKESFCAILLDLHLGAAPNGTEVIAEIRRTRPELLRRTIIATGDPGNPSVDAIARELGVAVLAKPFGLADLRWALDDAER